MPARCVLLRHQLDDGTWHFDWMLERPALASTGCGPESRVLLTFRVVERIDDAACRRFPSVRLGDHRRAYLDYQGPVSGGRGRVERVASGRVLRLVEHDDTLEIAVAWDSGAGAVWRGERGTAHDEWMFARDESPG